MTDTEAFLNLIEEKGVKFDKIAQICGISRVTLRNKIHNKTGFYAYEVQLISKFLGLPTEDTLRIFFAPSVHPQETEETEVNE